MSPRQVRNNEGQHNNNELLNVDRNRITETVGCSLNTLQLATVVQDSTFSYLEGEAGRLKASGQRQDLAISCLKIERPRGCSSG